MGRRDGWKHLATGQFAKDLCQRSKERGVDRLRNAIIKERCGYELSVLERIERNVLKWFGHVERMREEMEKVTGGKRETT